MSKNVWWVNNMDGPFSNHFLNSCILVLLPCGVMYQNCMCFFYLTVFLSYSAVIFYIESFGSIIRMCFFGAVHGWGDGGKKPPFLKSITHILQWWNLAQLYLTKWRSKKCINHVIHSLSSADISIDLDWVLMQSF